MTKSKMIKPPWVIIINVILIVGIVIAFAIFSNMSLYKLKRQNINDIININQATANISSAVYDSKRSSLVGIRRYADFMNMSRNELLEYIDETAGDKSASFQLIDQDYFGYAAKKENQSYASVNYTSNDYTDLHVIFNQGSADASIDTVSYTPEFTDNFTGFKSFALYCHVPVIDSDGQRKYDTLLFLINTAEFVSFTNIDGGFTDFNSVLMNQSGNYIIGNSAFKSSNFFQYLYVFNDLSMDQQKQIAAEVKSKPKGELYYKNSVGQDCVFVFTKLPQMPWYCISCVPLSSFHGEPDNLSFPALITLLLVILLFVDVAWLRRLNIRLQESVVEARSASVAKTDFLSRMSHDIRTPLNVITGMTRLAILDSREPAISEYLENIQSSGKFLTGLVNDILDLNKVESGKMELHPAPYSVKEFKRYIDAIIMPQCQKKNQSFKMDMNIEDNFFILVDSLRFNQIFFNLLTNAVKYTPEGGHIFFSVDIEPLPETDNELQISCIVSDDGIGMSKEFQAHLFEAFTQENIQRTGSIASTGLGLAIVKSILDLMHGDITVESVPKQGTTFHVTIIAPRANGSTVKVIKDTLTRDEFLRDKYVLLCEDHPMNSVIVVNLLTRKGMYVDSEPNGKAGLEHFTESKPGYYSAILMDIQMPIMDGMTATREIRKLTRKDAKTIPIIAMTANAYDIDIQNSLDAGMNAHIAKPIDPEEVFDILAEYISANEELN